MSEPGIVWTRAQGRGWDKLRSGATHVGFLGGSRSGKTFQLCYAIAVRALLAPGSRHAIFRFRFNALKASIVSDTMPKVLKLGWPALPGHKEMLNHQDMYLKLPNGSEIWYGGLDDKERTEKILGMEFATIYYNECSQIPWGSIKLARTRLAMKVQREDGSELPLRAYYDFNPPSKAHWTYKLFMKGESPDDRRPLDKGNYCWERMNPKDNQANIADNYIQELEQLPQRERLRFLEGMFADAVDGALWTEELLDQQRIHGLVPDLIKVVVAVDPSGAKGDEDVRSDEIGIVVVGIDNKSHGYVIEDLSGRYGPKEWGEIVVGTYERYAADAVVAEKNFGGAMVEETIQAQGKDNVHVKLVNASRGTGGKHVRAEPISALFEKQRIWMVGFHQDLEEQLCGFAVSGYMGSRSPDRADAMIWGFHELFQAMAKPEAERSWQRPAVKLRKRSASRFMEGI